MWQSFHGFYTILKRLTGVCVGKGVVVILPAASTQNRINLALAEAYSQATQITKIGVFCKNSYCNGFQPFSIFIKTWIEFFKSFKPVRVSV